MCISYLVLLSQYELVSFCKWQRLSAACCAAPHWKISDWSISDKMLWKCWVCYSRVEAGLHSLNQCNWDSLNNCLHWACLVCNGWNWSFLSSNSPHNEHCSLLQTSCQSPTMGIIHTVNCYIVHILNIDNNNTMHNEIIKKYWQKWKFFKKNN